MVEKGQESKWSAKALADDSAMGECKLFSIDSGNSLRLTVTNYGATLLSCKSRKGELPSDEKKDAEAGEPVFEELTLQRDNFKDLADRNKNPYYGATVGRVAGRIANAAFTVPGTENVCKLAVNNGPNCLHGGAKGWDQYFWDAEVIEEGTVKLSQFCTLAKEQ